jgi:hypothetical protein
MKPIAFYSIPTCADSLIAIDRSRILVHIHGKWKGDRPLRIHPHNVAIATDVADVMEMRLIPASEITPPLMIFQDGLS